MSSVATNAAIALQLALVIAGLVLLWKVGISPAARRRAGQPRIPSVQFDGYDFLFLALLVLLGLFVGGLAASWMLKLTGLKGDAATVVAGAATQLGMLGAVAGFAARSHVYRAQAQLPLASIVASGVATFLISLPLLHGVGKAWEVLLRQLGVPSERQELIRMFAEADSARFLTLLIFLAIVVAPVAEELVFRAGLFRFVRQIAPRWLALVIPGLVFAALHVNWGTLEGFASFAPLLVLAVIFSVAYERTGHIGTTIVAHGLFNLNTIILIFCGLATP